MTSYTIEIPAVYSHVDIQGLIRLCQRTVQIAVFHTVTATSVKMAGTAVFSAGPAYILGSLFQLGLYLFSDLAGVIVHLLL